jgi:hypothetical protein
VQSSHFREFVLKSVALAEEEMEATRKSHAFAGLLILSSFLLSSLEFVIHLSDHLFFIVSLFFLFDLTFVDYDAVWEQRGETIQHISTLSCSSLPPAQRCCSAIAWNCTGTMLAVAYALKDKTQQSKFTFEKTEEERS